VSDIPRVEAEILLKHVLGTSRSTLLTHPERPLTTVELDGYRALVDERALGYPLPYLTGEAAFYGLDIEVTPEVMIPRPETEVLVELALARRPASVIDVGTGSGCIAVALVTHLPEVTVYAIDISRPALAVAQRNAERHGVEDQIQFMVGDLLDRRPAPVDLIVSNPPYVSADEWASLPSAIRHHEPRLALDGGADGLEVIRRLLSQSEGLLEPGDALLVEIGVDQGDAVRGIARTRFPEHSTTIRTHPDLAGRDRVLEVQV
jgi:release factor glutamine methyltransferase